MRRYSRIRSVASGSGQTFDNLHDQFMTSQTAVKNALGQSYAICPDGYHPNDSGGIIIALA